MLARKSREKLGRRFHEMERKEMYSRCTVALVLSHLLFLFSAILPVLTLSTTFSGLVLTAVHKCDL